jgi:hypothetical protein
MQVLFLLTCLFFSGFPTNQITITKLSTTTTSISISGVETAAFAPASIRRDSPDGASLFTNGKVRSE